MPHRRSRQAGLSRGGEYRRKSHARLICRWWFSIRDMAAPIPEQSADGVYEKNIVYATARYLARDLAATGRFQVALTRGPDEFVPLRERVAKARTLHADLFLAIHADALPDPPNARPVGVHLVGAGVRPRGRGSRRQREQGCARRLPRGRASRARSATC